MAVGSVLVVLTAAVLGLAAWSVAGVLLAPSPFTDNGGVPSWWAGLRIGESQQHNWLLSLGVTISRLLQVAITVLTITAMILGLIPKPKAWRQARPVHDRWR
jgi:hypothetical protein